jgi:hypothetical protein
MGPDFEACALFQIILELRLHTRKLRHFFVSAAANARMEKSVARISY